MDKVIEILIKGAETFHVVQPSDRLGIIDNIMNEWKESKRVWWMDRVR